MSTTITTSSSSTPASVTFTFQDSDVIKVSSSITCEIEHLPLPLLGPMGAFGFDFNGVVKIITVEGRLTTAGSTRTSSGTVTSILAQKQWLEALMNGDQNSIGPFTFSSDYEQYSVEDTSSNVSPQMGTYAATKVYIQKIDFNDAEAEVNQLPFTMSLIVAGS